MTRCYLLLLLTPIVAFSCNHNPTSHSTNVVSLQSPFSITYHFPHSYTIYSTVTTTRAPPSPLLFCIFHDHHRLYLSFTNVVVQPPHHSQDSIYYCHYPHVVYLCLLPLIPIRVNQNIDILDQCDTIYFGNRIYLFICKSLIWKHEKLKPIISEITWKILSWSQTNCQVRKIKKKSN